jgi:hypothetical protein
MAHEQEFVTVRMRQTIDQFPLVLELLMDHVYVLPKFYADRLLDNAVCELVQDPTPSRLEAATLAGPRRRG